MALHLVPGIGPRRFHRLLSTFGSAREALVAPPAALREVLGPACAAAVLDEGARRVRLEAARTALVGLGGQVRVWGEPDYPARLEALPHPPPVLWFRGALWTGPAVAIVGTRRASRRACDWAEAAAVELAAVGCSVVSGGAYGVDAAAHWGSLRAEGATQVVLGGGLDRPYPDRHIPLFETAAASGAVLSPFPVGTPPSRGGFLARNALIAALSDAVVVVEAGWKSGARSTALHARTLGRPVLAVPGSTGTDRLLAEGAVALPTPQALLAWRAGRGAPDQEAVAAPEDPLLRLLAALGQASAAELSARLGLPVSRVLASLVCHQLSGHLVELPGGRFRWLGSGSGGDE